VQRDNQDENLQRDNLDATRIAASKNVPERSCRCLNRMFPGVLTPAEPRFGRLLMAVWRVKLPNCATRQTAISVCAAWSGPDFRLDVSDKHRPPSGSSNRDTDGRPGNLFE